MFGATRPVAPNAPDPRRRNRRRRGLVGGPLLFICCVLSVLFLVAATIILSLIPVYLPTKVLKLSGFTETCYVLGDYSGSLGNDHQLDATECQNLAQTLEQKLGLPAGTITIDEAAIATTPRKRKRRGYDPARFRRGETSRGFQRLYIILRLARAKCFQCKLRLKPFIIILTVSFGGNTFTQPITINMCTTPFTIPALLPPITSTVQTTTSANANIGVTTNAIG
ncbi:unnamed protein product [Rotaria sp. Silwood2]|nr:unnamed protein product [Rotaria sp. Silwood2]CAF4406949.1 unnamed protein product [Rotaria sp. Silwood2]